MKRYKMTKQQQQLQYAVRNRSVLSDDGKFRQKVQYSNNTIWLYDDIDDQSLYRLKFALQNINQMFDAWLI